MKTRLYRSSTDRMLGGVCGGLAEFLSIDTTIIRLIVAASVLFMPFIPLIYILLWIIIPIEPAGSAQLIEGSAQPIQQPAQFPPAQDPTGEWQYDPYTGQPIPRNDQQS
ncbi:MAG: PspC domain-containing protein [Chloroflexaceae bacterium]|nr:PspC domain-containing protein [Chloroflexaceae bacterium]